MNVRVTTESTVSRVDEKIDEAPGSVYVYTDTDIHDRGYHNIADLLKTVPGFTVFHRDLDEVMGVRGLSTNDNDKVSLMVNGQRILGLHEQDFLNGPINLDNVERVEVVVGPSSLFEPANTLTATINVITKAVDDVEVTSSYGNYLNYSETLMTGHHWAPDKFVSFSFTSEAMSGFNAWNPDFRPGLAGKNATDQLDWPNYFGVLNGQFEEWTAQAIAYQTSFPELNLDSASALNHAEMEERYFSFMVKNEHPWTGTLTSIARAEVEYKAQTRINQDGTPMGYANQNVLHQLDYSGELGLRYTGFQDQVIQGGIQTSYSHNYDTWFTYNSPPVTAPPPANIPLTTLTNADTAAFGFYLDDTIEVTKWLKLVDGVRIDENSVLHGDRWYPGARSAIILNPTSFWVSKLIYNRAVRMPDASESLNQVWGSGDTGNPNNPAWAQTSPVVNEPEILSTYEFQNIFYMGHVRLGATFYHEELEDFIEWFAPHSNGGNFRGNGVELSLQAPLTSQLTLWANGAWNDTKLDLFNPSAFGPPTPTNNGFHAYVDPQGRLIGSAAYTANLGIDWKIIDHLTFSPAFNYFTDQAAAEFNPQPGDHTLYNRCYFNAGLTWDHIFGKDMDVRFSGDNLLNNREQVASPQNGDTYRPRGIDVVGTLVLRF